MPPNEWCEPEARAPRRCATPLRKPRTQTKTPASQPAQREPVASLPEGRLRGFFNEDHGVEQFRDRYFEEIEVGAGEHHQQRPGLKERSRSMGSSQWNECDGMSRGREQSLVAVNGGNGDFSGFVGLVDLAGDSDPAPAKRRGADHVVVGIALGQDGPGRSVGGSAWKKRIRNSLHVKVVTPEHDSPWRTERMLAKPCDVLPHLLIAHFLTSRSRRKRDLTALTNHPRALKHLVEPPRRRSLDVLFASPDQIPSDPVSGIETGRFRRSVDRGGVPHSPAIGRNAAVGLL